MLTILYAEADDGVRKAVAGELTRLGYRVRSIGSLEELKRLWHGQNFDLLLVEPELATSGPMRGVNPGWEYLAQIAQEPRRKPIIVLTTNDRNRTLLKHADVYLLKPHLPSVLRSSLRRLLVR